MGWHTRRNWQAFPPKAVTRLRPERVSHLFLHHTTGWQADTEVWLRSIQAFHQKSRGWSDIAYSWLVSADGHIWQGRGWEAAGGHTRDWNSRSIGVAYLGDGGKSVPPEAVAAIVEVMDEADRRFGRKLTRQGHRDAGATACPGDVLYAWLKAGADRPAVEMPTLRVGARGDAVRRVQGAVGVTPDGIFGPLTDAALRAFQRREGLTGDGVVGPLTWTAIRRATGG
jgi:hypothetical protein